MIKLFFLHFIADFLLQSREMGKNKSSNWGWLFAHLVIQFLVFLPFAGGYFALANAMIHGIIDRNIWSLYKKLCEFRMEEDESFSLGAFSQMRENEEFEYWEDHWFYVTIGLDQFLHAATLIFLAKMYL